MQNLVAEYRSFLKDAVARILDRPTSIVDLVVAAESLPADHVRIPRATITDAGLTIVGSLNGHWVRPLSHVVLEGALAIMAGKRASALALVRRRATMAALDLAAAQNLVPLRPTLDDHAGMNEIMYGCWSLDGADLVVHEALGLGSPAMPGESTPAWTLIGSATDMARVWHHPARGTTRGRVFDEPMTTGFVPDGVEDLLRLETRYWSRSLMGYGTIGQAAPASVYGMSSVYEDEDEDEDDDM